MRQDAVVVDDEGAGEEVGQPAASLVEQNRQVAREQWDDRNQRSDSAQNGAPQGGWAAVTSAEAQTEEAHPRRLPGAAPEEHEVSARIERPARCEQDAH